MNEFSLTLTDEQEQLRDWIHQFCVDVVRPNAEEWDEREEFPWPIVQEAAKIGLYGWDFLAQGMIGDKTGLTMPVAIGATEHMLTYGRLHETLPEILRNSGLPASALELNLPEACLMHEHDELVKTLYALDSLGVRIAITGIGATPLPLGRLRQRPVHRVKLDRSLVRDLANPDNHSVLAATLAAAGALGLGVQAVGVEFAEQQAALLALGCHQQQGRHFAAPLPPDDFAQLL